LAATNANYSTPPTLAKFIAFSPSKDLFAPPEAEISNQNLAGMSSPDLLIGYTSRFKREARGWPPTASHDQMIVVLVIPGKYQ